MGVTSVGKALTVALALAGPLCWLAGCGEAKAPVYWNELTYQGEGLYYIGLGPAGTDADEIPLARGTKRIGIEFLIFNGLKRPIFLRSDVDHPREGVSWEFRPYVPGTGELESTTFDGWSPVTSLGYSMRVQLLPAAGELTPGQPIPLTHTARVAFRPQVEAPAEATHADLEFTHQAGYYPLGDLRERSQFVSRTLRLVFTDAEPAARAKPAATPGHAALGEGRP